MNINGKGDEIVILKDDPVNKNTSIYIDEKRDEKNKLIKYFDDLKIDDGYFQIVPDKKKDRNGIFIVGQNGSGKSFWIYLYLQEFMKRFPDYPIYFFSSKNQDENLDKIKKLKRITIDDSFITNPLDYNELERSMCIFDDIDALTKKGGLRDAVYELRDIIFKNGRSKKIHIIATSHSPTGRDIQTPLNESNMIVFFLKNYNRTMRYFLENYIGLEQDQIKKLRKNRTRSTILIKSQPNVIVQEKNIYTFETL